MSQTKHFHILPLTIGLIGAFAFMHVYSIQAILPLLITEFNATEVQVGLSVGATVMGMALISPFIGIISDAFGRKWLILLSLVLLTLPTLLIAHTKSINTLIFWRFIQGVSVPGMTVTLLAYIGEEFRGQVMAKLMFYYVSGTVLGGFSGRFLLGHLSEIMGWREAMTTMAGLNVIGLFLAWKMLKPSRKFTPKPLRAAGIMLISHLQNRYLLSASALGFGVLFSLVGGFTFVNLYLAAPPFSLTTGSLANIFTVYLIGMIITPWSAWLIKRFSAPKTILLAIGISMSGVLITGGIKILLIILIPLLISSRFFLKTREKEALIFNKSLLLLFFLGFIILFIIAGTELGTVILGLILISSGVFITQSATIGYIASHVTEGRSLATGIYYALYYFGGTVGSWLCGIAYQKNGWYGVMITLLIVQIFAWIIAYFFMLKKDS